MKYTDLTYNGVYRLKKTVNIKVLLIGNYLVTYHSLTDLVPPDYYYSHQGIH